MISPALAFLGQGGSKIHSSGCVCLAADAVGLGSCYVGSVLECFRELIEMFSLPAGVFPVVLLSLGYPKSVPKPARKLGVEIIVHDERYREPGDEELLAAMEAKHPGYRLEATEERRRALREVCREAHGEDYAKRAAARIDRDGFISMVQYYFGLHYRADLMPRGNGEFVRIMAESGLQPFAEFVPGSSWNPSAADRVGRR